MGSIVASRVESARNFAIGLSGGARVDVSDCVLLPDLATVSVASLSFLTGSGNRVEAGSVLTMRFSGDASAQFNGNDIELLAEQSIVLDGYASRSEPVDVDLTGNYWGTTEVDSISARIWDGSDDPEIKGFVHFDPFLSRSVPGDKKSMGVSSACSPVSDIRDQGPVLGWDVIAGGVVAKC